MLYETLAQPLILFYVLIFGFLSGVIFDFATFLHTLFGSNKVVRFILDFVATFLCFVVLFFVILTFAYGELRLWHILFFVASLLLERATIGKLVAKAISVCYNFFVKILRKIFAVFQKKKRKNYDEKPC